MTTLFPSQRVTLVGRLLITLLFCFASCRKQAINGDNTPLRIAVSVEISSLDPQITSSVESIKIQSALFETLVKVEPDTGVILPAGARNWEVSNGLVYTFHLREDACWSTGETIDANDYVFAFQRLFDPDLGAPFANLYFAIKGARDYLKGSLRDFSETGVQATNSHTLMIQLSEPVPYFLSLLARPCVSAIPRDWILQHGEVASRTSGWSLASGFPASGPYQLKEWVVNKWIWLERNPHYWNRGEIREPSVFFYSMESAYAQEQGFRAKALDITSKLTAEQVSKYLGSETLINQVEMGTFYIILNTQSPKLRSRELRRSLYQSVERETIVNELRKRGETSAYSFCPPLWSDTYPEVIKPADDLSDPALDPQSVETLKLLIPPSENNDLIAEALQDMWQKKLGIKVEIYRQEWKSYYDSRNRGQFELCLATWIGDYYDPLTFLEMWKSDSPNNYCRWSDLVFDQMLEKSALISSPEERFAELAKAEQRFMQDYPVIPIFYLSRIFLVSEQLDSWPQTILNTIDYTRIRRNRN
jgi:oligopeptide transport system substrate-binding protein